MKFHETHNSHIRRLCTLALREFVNTIGADRIVSVTDGRPSSNRVSIALSLVTFRSTSTRYVSKWMYMRAIRFLREKSYLNREKSYLNKEKSYINSHKMVFWNFFKERKRDIQM